MVECDYCGETFPDNESYLQHLADTHEGELGRIDRRRVADFTGEDTEESEAGRYVLGALGLLGAVVVGMVGVWFVTGSVPFLGGGSANVNAVQEPTGSPGSLHEHGTMEATIAGQEIDFSRSQYQLNADCFHFEAGEGRVWHTHCRGVTLQWALGTLGIETNADGSNVTFDGETYRESGPWNVSVRVNGDAVDPGNYVLQGVNNVNNVQQGDHVRLVVEREA